MSDFLIKILLKNAFQIFNIHYLLYVKQYIVSSITINSCQIHEKLYFLVKIHLVCTKQYTTFKRI